MLYECPPLQEQREEDALAFRPRSRNTFKRTDLARAIRSARDAGVDVRGIEIAPDKITLMFGKSDEKNEAPEDLEKLIR
jgi:hypothetical protein